MRIFAISAIALTLAACGASPQEQEADLALVRSKMPNGCTVEYAGEVRVNGSGYPSRIFYAQCGNTVTATETHHQQTGKTGHEESTVTVNDAAVLGATSQM